MPEVELIFDRQTCENDTALISATLIKSKMILGELVLLASVREGY